MPYVPDQEWSQYKKKVDDLAADVDKLKDMLRNVKGAPPAIQGSQGKRLDLNENLNVIELFKKINSWTITVTDSIKFKFSATNEPRLYLYMTIDAGKTWNECTSWPT